MYKRSKGVIGFIVCFLCAISMVGCGKNAADDLGEDGGESIALASISSQMAANGNQNVEPVWAGAQFYDGEAVSVWRKMNKAENVVETQDIYLYDSKGNQRLVVDDAPWNYVGDWFIAKDGYCFTVSDNKLIRVEADGTEAYSVVVESGVQDICQLEDGRFAIVLEETSGNYKLAELNPDNGEYRKLEKPELGADSRQFITPYDEGILLLKRTVSGKLIWKAVN